MDKVISCVPYLDMLASFCLQEMSALAVQSSQKARNFIGAAMQQGREVGDEDQFHFNTEFSERLYRIKINAIQMKETVDENKKTNDQVLQDRQYQVGQSLQYALLYVSPNRLHNTTT